MLLKFTKAWEILLAPLKRQFTITNGFSTSNSSTMKRKKSLNCKTNKALETEVKTEREEKQIGSIKRF